jgi:large subunit ribosomal protein L15
VVVTPDALKQAGLIRKMRDGVKVLGSGDAPKKPLRFRDVAFSGTAKSKLEAAGATFEE